MFSNVSRLEVNKHKSEVFYACMTNQEIQRVTDVSCFDVGKLSFRYLGVLMSTRKLKASDCQALIGKMVCRIMIWNTS